MSIKPKSMFIKTFISSGILVILWGLNPGYGEPLEIDLQTARQMGLERNPQIKLAREAVSKSRAKTSESFGGLLPSLSVAANYQRAWELPTVFFDNPDPLGPDKLSFKMGSEHTFQSGVQLQQPVFLGGAIWNGYQMARLGASISESQLEAVHQQVLLDITNTYYSVLFAQSLVQVMEEALEVARTNLKQVKDFQKVGKASDFDRLRAEVQVANYQPQLLSAKNNVRLAISRLQALLDLPENREIKVVGTLEYRPNPWSQLPVDTLIDLALNSRPEVDQLRYQQKMAKKQLQLAWANLSPQLMFGTSYQYQAQRDDAAFTGDDFYTSFNSSFSINIPLFNGLRNQAKIEQAKIGINETEYREESLVNGIRVEVKNAFFSMQEAEEIVMTRQKIVEQAREALRLANLRYKEGASTQLEVMNSEVAFNQANVNYRQSLLEYHMALAQLNKAMDRL